MCVIYLFIFSQNKFDGASKSGIFGIELLMIAVTCLLRLRIRIKFGSIYIYIFKVKITSKNSGM